MKKDIVPIVEPPTGSAHLLPLLGRSPRLRWTAHFSQTVPYSVPEVLTDLIDFAARSLVTGGFLAYWLPTTNEYKDSDLPRTPPHLPPQPPHHPSPPLLRGLCQLGAADAAQVAAASHHHEEDCQL